MPDPLSADRTAELLLWFWREPARYRAEGRRRDAPLLDSEVVLKLALGRPTGLAATAPGDTAAAARLQEAAASYVRHLYFRPDATPYQTLGLAPGASPQAIKENFRLLMHLVHPDRQGTRTVWPDAFAAQANRAYAILRNQDARTRFDRDAEARAAMARAMHRAAAAAAASKMPVVLRPRPRLGGGGLLRRMPLPEWLTVGVGGYVREHPATIAFSLLIVVAALTIGMMGLEGEQEWLTREVQAGQAPSAPTILAVAPDAAPAPATEVGAPELPGAAANSTPPPQASPPLAVVANADAAVTRAPAPGVPSDDPLPVAGATEPEPVTPVAVVAKVESNAPPAPPPATTEIETLFALFVETYERGRADAFAALFDADADANLRHGRAAIRGEYDELFRLSQWRRMQLTRVNWKRVGDRTIAKGEITVRIGWRDGREVEQRLAVDIELVRRDGRVVIARLSQQPMN